MSREDLAFRLILRKIESNSMLDFSNYKYKCLRRRIRVRLRALDIGSLSDYYEYLMDSKEELTKLIDTITINVTQFFRDITAFKFIYKNIFLPYSEDKDLERLKVWSAACASGEEVYSIAIFLLEAFKRRKFLSKIKIIGTDIDIKSLEVAEKGIYPAKNLKILIKHYPQFLEKYFIPEPDNHYRVKDILRKNVKFENRDVIRDQHFKNVDIIFCRNLFIYFEKELQKEILSKFHEDLKEEGYLILGKVETILGFGESLFDSVSIKERVYKKI